MNGDDDQRIGYGAALASRELRALLVGQLVSVAGTSVAAVALTIIVYRRTESPFLSSLTFALGFVPYVLAGGLLSSIVDRVRPRRLVACSDGAAAVLAAAMALPGLPVWVLFGLLLAVGVLTAIEGGARATLVRASVHTDAYVPARSLLRIAAQLAQVAGNAAGGTLLLVLSPSGTLLVNAASFAFSAATVRIGVADHANTGAPAQASVLADSLRGARDILAQPELRRLLLIGWLAPMFAVAPEALAAPYVADRHGSAAFVGVWLVALPLGLIAGDIFGVRFLSPRMQRRLVAPVVIAGFVPYLVFAGRPPIPVALCLLVVSGFCSFYALGLDARVRDAAPTHQFARTMALNSAGLMTLQGLGFALAGAIAQATGAGAAIALAGVLGIAGTALLVRPVRLQPRRARRVGAARRAVPRSTGLVGRSRMELAPPLRPFFVLQCDLPQQPRRRDGEAVPEATDRGPVNPAALESKAREIGQQVPTRELGELASLHRRPLG